MYTKLADYDIMGFDPTLGYSFEVKPHPGLENPIVLPTWPWRQLPAILPKQGNITARITIVQTGQGNDARELRVEGNDPNGQGGYFRVNSLSSSITSSSSALWEFVAYAHTGPVEGPFLRNDGQEALGPTQDRRFTGPDLSSSFGFAVTLQLIDFQPFCSPATIVLRVEDSQFNLTTHHRFVWPKSELDLVGMLMLPAELVDSPDAHVRAVVAGLFPASSTLLHNASMVPLFVQILGAQDPPSGATVILANHNRTQWSFGQ